MTTGHIDPRYGDASATAPPWDTVERLLTEAKLYWIVTVRADGRPHAVPLVGVSLRCRDKEKRRAALTHERGGDPSLRISWLTEPCRDRGRPIYPR
jgi:hypothetical protein